MRASRLAYLVAILPLLTIHLTWLISASVNNLHWCNPYWHLCHSVSATGRLYPEFFVFKGLMIPAACGILIYWWLLKHWMRQMAIPFVTRIHALGTLAALALVVYTVTLGAVGEPYALARRMGVILFFGLTPLAHLLLLAACRASPHFSEEMDSELRRMKLLLMTMLLLGVGSVIAGFLWSGYDDWENAVEWWFAVMMPGLFVLVGRLWRHTQFFIQMNMKR